MTGKKWLLLFYAILILVSTSAFSPAPQNGSEVTLKVTQVDTSRFPQVIVYVSAVDNSGNPVVVDPSHIVLRENDQQVKTGVIASAGEQGSLTTMLLIDVSGSMKSSGKLAMAKKVAGDYVAQMRSNDQAGIIAFNTSVKQVQAVTSDHDLLNKAIEGLTAQHDTAMYDALMRAEEALNPLEGRKAIILLTDGLDNRSKHTPTDVISGIGTSGLSISTIGLGNPGQSTGNLAALDEKTLTALAENAGGSYSLATDQESLSRVYEKYGRELRSEYAITYTSASALRDGLNRNLSVSYEAGSIVNWSKAVQTRFNPGGLVPEVSHPASWPLFLALLAILVVLLFLPMVLRAIKQPAGTAKAVSSAPPPPRPARIKLK